MRSFAALAALVSLAACAPAPILAPAIEYTNPVLDRDFPDPAVLKAPDGWFYVYATQTRAGERWLNIQVARSTDLVRWEHLGEALPAKPPWGASKQDFWAPHVIHDPALGYFMYYSAEPDKARGKCLAVARASRPEGPFVDAGEPLLCGQGVEHIDPMAFDDPRSGKRLLYWGTGPIRVRELAPDRMRFAPEGAVDLIVRQPGLRYRSLVEGAWVIYRHGSYYLFFSGDRCCGPSPNYALMVARADHPFGPFEVLPAPILEAGGAWLAPGHNSVVTDDAGDDWILYHAMRQPPDRLMLMDRIDYREGWPRIAGSKPSSGNRQAPRFSRPAP